MLFATFVNLVICFLTVGLQYAIWKYYLSILLVLIAVVVIFFTLMFGGYFKHDRLLLMSGF